MIGNPWVLALPSCRLPRLLVWAPVATLCFPFESRATADPLDVFTYADHVEPIIRTHCVDCHSPGGIGPFSLNTFQEVRRRGRQIAEVTESGFMPPWKPEPGYGPKLQDERRLKDDEIATLSQWFDAGMPSGDLSQVSPPPPAQNGWRLGEPDLILELPQPYPLPAEGLDIYRNFALPLGLSETRYIRAVEFQTSTRLAIHHALFLTDNTGRARVRDRSEPGVGYDGMGIGSALLPAGHIIGWTPGQRPYETPAGTGWEVGPDSDVVLQLHLQPTGRIEPINPRIGLYFAGTKPPLTSFVFQLRSFDIDIPAGEANYTIRESLTVPTDVDVLGVYPHAHYIGRDLRIFAILPDGREQGLLRIPEWDFNWQGDYRFENPLRLPAGTVLHMVYVYDNSAENPFKSLLPASPRPRGVELNR